MEQFILMLRKLLCWLGVHERGTQFVTIDWIEIKPGLRCGTQTLTEGCKHCNYESNKEL